MVEIGNNILGKRQNLKWDLSIAQSTIGNGKDVVTMVFRNRALGTVNKYERVYFKVEGDRMYICCSNSKGFLLQRHRSESGTYVAIKASKDVKAVKKFVGGYEIKIAPENGFMFIEKGNMADTVEPEVILDNPYGTPETNLDTTGTNTLDEIITILKSIETKLSFLEKYDDPEATAKTVHLILKNAIKDGFEEVGK